MRISVEKKNKITEQVLSYIYSRFPYYPFTAEIAREVARDEEFIKKLLFDLKERSLLVSITKNNRGEPFTRRIRWRLSNKVYDIYSSNK